MTSKKILVLEPYYGGSHKLFLDTLIGHLPAHCTLLTLPARKWKMRMQLSAPWFVQKINEMPAALRAYDIVLSSTFLDLAVFKALISNLPGWNSKATYLTYFHENQFKYPGTKAKETNHQFTAINFTTALVSDGLAFNSDFNRKSFLGQCAKYIRKAVDMDLVGEVAAIEIKSKVLYPVLDFRLIDNPKIKTDQNEIPLIIWNHRWEHDKNPEEFFETLTRLHNANIPYRLALLGQRFREYPSCFKEARQTLKNSIVHFGYVEDRNEYYALLKQGDIVVSTAVHEFFGISVIEAVRAGCTPLLPNRLSYPELFEAEYLYGEGQLFDSLKRLLSKKEFISFDKCHRITNDFSWQSLQTKYNDWFSI